MAAERTLCTPTRLSTTCRIRAPQFRSGFGVGAAPLDHLHEHRALDAADQRRAPQREGDFIVPHAGIQIARRAPQQGRQPHGSSPPPLLDATQPARRRQRSAARRPRPGTHGRRAPAARRRSTSRTPDSEGDASASSVPMSVTGSPGASETARRPASRDERAPQRRVGGAVIRRRRQAYPLAAKVNSAAATNAGATRSCHPTTLRRGTEGQRCGHAGRRRAERQPERRPADKGHGRRHGRVAHAARAATSMPRPPGR